MLRVTYQDNLQSMGWKVEAFRMTVYMAFPVALFHWFNQPEYFEKFVISEKRKMLPHDDEHRGLDEVFRRINNERAEREQKTLEQLQNKESH